MNGVPPRQIPAEPSYLILSTAVSEKFSPPCEGLICNSIWPSNFTIDYVRVYQDAENPFASTGCDLPDYPTKKWIMSNPVAYGLPWYITLDFYQFLLHAVALTGLMCSTFICFWKFNLQHRNQVGISLMASFGLFGYISSILLNVVSSSLSPSLEWMTISFCAFSGLIFAVTCAVYLEHANILVLVIFSVFVFIAPMSQNVLLLRTFVVFGTAFLYFLSYRYERAMKPFLVQHGPSSVFGGLGIVLSLSQLIESNTLLIFLCQSCQLLISGGLSSGSPPFTKPLIPLCSLYGIFIICVYQFLYAYYYSPKYAPIGKKNRSQRSSTIFASVAARQRAPVASSNDAKEHVPLNMLPVETLTQHMSELELIQHIGKSIQHRFGFQSANVANQTEHLMLLLSNINRDGVESPFSKLHNQMFENYRKWCVHLEVLPVCHQQIFRGNEGLNDIIVDLCLYFFIWGEASNLRHTPEYLLFVYHQIKSEYSTAKPSTQTVRQEGFFIDAVVTPIYDLIKGQMRLPKDHEFRRNYDDFNEFFWNPQCLKYSYFCPDAHDDNLSSQQQPLRDSESIAEAYSRGHKTFVEIRSWLSPLRAFRRIVEFHIVSFQLLASLAFINHIELDGYFSLRMISSILLTPILLSICWDFLEIYMRYGKETSSTLNLMHRATYRIAIEYLAVSILFVMYVQCWFVDSEKDISFSLLRFWIFGALFNFPGFCNCILQICPNWGRWLWTTRSPIVLGFRKMFSTNHEIFVGDNILDTSSQSWAYQCYWISMILWKLFFSYRFEIEPLIQPSVLLFRDHIYNGVGLSFTILLISFQWIFFFMVYSVDLTIWNSLWVAFSGMFVGFSLRIGVIRNFHRVRKSFLAAVNEFNRKLISSQSESGKEMNRDNRNNYGGISSIQSEILESTILPKTASTEESEELTPLLSFSRRQQGSADKYAVRKQKWGIFSTAWNEVISTMRAGDIVSNKEKQMLEFVVLDGYKREVYLPVFQLAGYLENVVALCSQYASSESIDADHDGSLINVEHELVSVIESDEMMAEAVGETWELMMWLLVQLLGPCHSNDIHFINECLNSWRTQHRMMAGIDFTKITKAVNGLAEVVLMVRKSASGWKKSSKTIPSKRSPNEFAGAQFQAPAPASASSVANRHGLLRHNSSIIKSASTTGLSQLGGSVPRRSRGSGVAKIAQMQESGKKSNSRSLEHNIPVSQLMKIREKLRAFLNVAKASLKDSVLGDESHLLHSVSKAMSDRLTWILTQERGFMWDDGYTGEQLTLLAFHPQVDLVMSQLYGLLKLRKIDAQPQSSDARRRLLSFVNSLFMDMPSAPKLEEMGSWSVVTPFYGEDVLFSKSDLESKKDGLDVHTLLYLQTLYQKEWENFLERVKPRHKNQNLWKDPVVAQELRLWASLRGQTLVRTVQGMMYGEAALRLLAKLEKIPESKVEELVKRKFTYVVACQIYGRQKRNNDSKAHDIEFLLHRFPNLRVAYIDEIRFNYHKDHSYFAVLVKSTSETTDSGDDDVEGEEKQTVEEVYRIRLPGNPILGEGKPENQNAAIIFTRGESLQTIDMNQDGYLEENLKMRNILEEFKKGTSTRPFTIVGLPEHIFTGSVSSLANYMALQETTFVTLGQRTLANPLRMRLHYGHPDVFNKIFFMTRGGISKASKGINLSEDIFAGYNNALRGGSVAFPEYVKVGKGRDVGMQQIYKFEAKLAQGAAEQSLSRDVYRLGHGLDFFKLLSFYYNHVGFYLNMSFICWVIFCLTYLNLIRSLFDLETIGGREQALQSEFQLLLGSVAFLTTAPLLATISVERGFKAALEEVFVVFITGGPLYFLFHIGTKWFYFGQTILAGGAKYRATGRGFVTQHVRFDDLFRFYASSHLYGAVEIAVALILFAGYTKSYQYFALTWSLWLVVFSWVRTFYPDDVF